MYTYNIKKAANSFVKEHGVTSKTVESLKLLSGISEKESYKVYRFGDEHDEIIQLLNAESFCRTNIAFSVCRGDMRCIFIKSDVPDKAAAKLLLHELAHIRLHHLDKCETTVSASENDADVFVNYVRARVSGNIRRTRRMIAVIMVCLAITAIVYAVHLWNTSSSEYTVAVPVVNDVDDTDTFTVYITDTGDKYHERDCYHLKGRDITALSIDTAESMGREPCKDCILK